MRSEAEIKARFESLSRQAHEHAAERGGMSPEHRIELQTLSWILDSETEERQEQEPPHQPLERRDDYY